jgi:hypothetical protein
MAFSKPGVQALFENGRSIRVYIAGCPGMHEWARRLQIPLFKVSTTERGDLRARLAELSADAYGSATLHPGGRFIEEQGWDRWVMEHPALQQTLVPASPVSILPRCLEIRLPEGLLPLKFDRQLQAVLAPCAVEAFAATLDGAAYLAAMGAPPEATKRYTVYRFGDEQRISKAQEFIIFRPRIDTDRLITACERIILGYIDGEQHD